MTQYWITVASADHVERGVEGGFMQACHGKKAPLTRIKTGDNVLFYSPKVTFGGNEPLQVFTACGEVLAGDAYQFEVTAGFFPYRRDVRFDMAFKTKLIRPLIEQLSFIKDPKYWGVSFRFVFFEICEADFLLIMSKNSASI